jgi:serine/threonine protein kinase
MVTGIGTILGTAAYMSPEQAKGRAADKRSDIWVFGVVLYEMLTGKQAFAAEDVRDALAFILTKEPDWNSLPVNTSEAIRRLLRRCLEKDRTRRLADIADARLEIDNAQRDPEVAGLHVPNVARRVHLVWASAVTLVMLIAGGAALLRERASSVPLLAETRFEITTPPTSDPASFAISPDGRLLVFAASTDGQSRLWLCPLETLTVQPLPGTDGGRYPFLSPDSRAIGFFANGKLKRLDLGTGLPETLANAPQGHGGAWSPAGEILFAPASGGCSACRPPAATPSR